MAKKILSTIGIIILALVIVIVVFYIQDSTGNYEMEGLIPIIAVYVINGLIFGALTAYISDKKGYNSGFAWGFFLGIIGLLVVGFRPTLSKKKETIIVTPKIDAIEKLERLAKLHQQGVLTDEEFQKKKSEILAKM